MRKHRQDPRTGKMRGSIGSGRDTVPRPSRLHRPLLKDARNALVGTVFGVGAVVLGTPGAIAMPPVHRTDTTAGVEASSTMRAASVSKPSDCAAARSTVKQLVKKAHKTQIMFDKKKVSKAKLFQVKRDLAKAKQMQVQVCAMPTTPPGEDPSVVIARYSSPETAARTPQEALALVRAFPWTKQVTADSWTDFEADARLVGVPPTEEELAIFDEGFRGYSIGMYSPSPNVLVNVLRDVRPNAIQKDTLYSYATEYTNGWAVDPTKHVPVFRTMPDSNHPKGYRYEYFNEVNKKWEQANSMYLVITGWDS